MNVKVEVAEVVPLCYLIIMVGNNNNLNFFLE